MVVVKEFSEAVNTITHVDPFHGDDVFATAILSSIFNLILFRTRDKNAIDNINGIVYDVGGVYDEKKFRFDHHQRDFDECRPDGTPYASAGLLWRHYGRDVVKAFYDDMPDEDTVEEIFNMVDRNLIKWIDAADCGIVSDNGGMTVSSVISLFNPTWEESDVDSDECFRKACDVAYKILEREVRYAKSIVNGRKLVNERIEQSNGRILILDRYIDGWVGTVLNSESEKAASLLYAIFQDTEGKYGIQAIPPSREDIKGKRLPFPEQWCGLNGDALKEASGIKSAVFCHRNGFYAVVEDKFEALMFANKAIRAGLENGLIS